MRRKSKIHGFFTPVDNHAFQNDLHRNGLTTFFIFLQQQCLPEIRYPWIHIPLFHQLIRIRYDLQISLVILNEFKRINLLLFTLRPFIHPFLLEGLKTPISVHALFLKTTHFSSSYLYLLHSFKICIVKVSKIISEIPI